MGFCTGFQGLGRGHAAVYQAAAQIVDEIRTDAEKELISPVSCALRHA